MGTSKPYDMELVNNLAIPVFQNETLEPRIATLLTNATIKEFQNDGTFTITRKDKADAILVATISEINRLPFRFNRADRLVSQELNFQIVCDYYVADAINREVLASGTVTGNSNLSLRENFQLTERQALADAATKVAQNLMVEICEGW